MINVLNFVYIHQKEGREKGRKGEGEKEGRNEGRQYLPLRNLKLFFGKTHTYAHKHTHTHQSKNHISLIKSTKSKMSKCQISLKDNKCNLHVLDYIIESSKVFILNRVST